LHQCGPFSLTTLNNITSDRVDQLSGKKIIMWHESGVWCGTVLRNRKLKSKRGRIGNIIGRLCSSEECCREVKVQWILAISCVVDEIEAVIDIKVAAIWDFRCANHFNLSLIELFVFGMVGFRVSGWMLCLD